MQKGNGVGVMCGSVVVAVDWWWQRCWKNDSSGSGSSGTGSVGVIGSVLLVGLVKVAVVMGEVLVAEWLW